MVVIMSGQTETHSLGFLSVADPALISGEDNLPRDKQWPNGNAAEHRLFRRRWQSTGEDLNRRPKNMQPTALPFDRGLLRQCYASPLLGPF